MLQVGSVVISKMGHDFGRVYLITKIDGEFAFLCDGKYRKTCNPKKKRLKHLKDCFIVYNLDNDISSLYDYQIATFLKNVNIMHKN